MNDDLPARLDAALRARAALLEGEHDGAFRLLNGFLEGVPHLALDVYGRTLILQNHSDPPAELARAIPLALEAVLAKLPWIQVALLKEHRSRDPEAQKGKVVHGTEGALDKRVREGAVSYALDLRLNRDASLYLDTRGLRTWAYEKLKGGRVLNAFAYTGSLGVAAAMGGARRVIHTDLNADFLAVAKRSTELNGLPVVRADFRSGGFWEQVGRLRKAGSLFDAILLDPPFFSTTGQGTVDLVGEGTRLINKVRPLVGDGGALLAVNNALFLPGAEFLKSLEALGEYVKVEELIPVPPDSAGYPETRVAAPPTDPAPFNHSTKIAVLRLKRKDGKRAADTPEP